MISLLYTLAVFHLKLYILGKGKSVIFMTAVFMMCLESKYSKCLCCVIFFLNVEVLEQSPNRRIVIMVFVLVLLVYVNT